MALQGTLGDFGIADIFQLIGQQQKTGILHLSSKEEEVHIHFKEGNVVKAETASRKRKELLGHMLVRSALITPLQLDSALEEQKRTLRRLGDILVATGAITKEALRDTTHLQTTETLYALFGWKQGNYSFEQCEVEADTENFAPIRSESILMEGFRRVDEWPSVRKVITSPRMTFEKLKDPPVAAADDDDFGLDAAFGDADDKDDKKKKGDLGRTERRVMNHYAPTRTVQQYIDLSRLGEFEACKALSNLVADGYLKPVPPVGKDDDTLGAVTGKSVGERLREAAGKAAVTVLLVAAALLMYGQSGLATARQGAGATRLVDPAAQRMLSRSQIERLQGALQVYQLEHGEVPEKLEALLDEHLVEQSDLQFPWAERYYYRRTAAKSFVLLPPLQ